jgi:tetratricopeptide (TPR) repeat protein
VHRLALVGLFVLHGGIASAQPGGPAPTFTKDVAPILWTHCAGCHRPGQIAPFPLITYEDVLPRARQVAASVGARQMPPWMPERGHGDFENVRELSDTQIATVQRWVESGAPRGADRDLAAPPRWPADAWQLGTPSLVVEPRDGFVLRSGSADVFRTFVIPIPIDRTRYVRGIEVRPGSPRSVHHASLSIDRTSASRELDAADPAPGFDGVMFSEGARSPESRALGWTPGMRPAFEPAGMAWRLEPGADLVVELHLIAPTSSDVETVRPRVALYFADQPPTRLSMDFKIGVNVLDIAAGDAAHVAQTSLTLPVDADVLSVYPHAHYLARDVRAYATLPDGTVESLLWIKNWDFQWQDQYRYRAPVTLPRGSVITMRYTYDNSASNRRNPASPPRAVSYGPKSSDEMGDLWLRLAPRSAADAASLAQAYRDNERRKMLALNERMAEREPASARWRAALGTSYLEAGRLREAIESLTLALALEPGRVSTLGNLGEALRRQGRMGESLARFREALALSPDDVIVGLGLANALEDNGDLVEAVAAFERVLRINPGIVDAHVNLGVALGALGRLDEAEEHFRQALAIQPDNTDAPRNLALLAELRRRR